VHFDVFGFERVNNSCVLINRSTFLRICNFSQVNSHHPFFLSIVTRAPPTDTKCIANGTYTTYAIAIRNLFESPVRRTICTQPADADYELARRRRLRACPTTQTTSLPANADYELARQRRLPCTVGLVTSFHLHQRKRIESSLLQCSHSPNELATFVNPETIHLGSQAAEGLKWGRAQKRRKRREKTFRNQSSELGRRSHSHLISLIRASKHDVSLFTCGVYHCGSLFQQYPSYNSP